MFCVKCGSPLKVEHKFCNQCGAEISSDHSIETFSMIGGDGFNVGKNNFFKDNNIVIGKSNDEPKALVERVQSKKLKILGKNIKLTWVILAGFISLLANIATIINSFGSQLNFIHYFSLALSMFIFASGCILKQLRFLPLLFQRNIEADKKGMIYLTKIEGDCPKCDGALKLRILGPKNHKKTYFRCTRNPDHLWNFDPTIMEDPDKKNNHS